MNEQGQKRQFGWESIFMRGTVLDLDIKVWTARTGIKAKDLGIENSSEVEKVLSLGCYRLAPKESFGLIRDIAARAKRAVEYSSFNFGLIRGARFIPDQKLAGLLQELGTLQTEFSQASDAYCFTEYDTIRIEMLPIIRKASQDASRNPELVEEAFSRIMSEYPTKEEVRKKFSMTWTLYSIRGPQTDAAAEYAGQETENVKGIIRDMVVQLREEVKERIGAVMGSIAKSGKLPKKTIDATRETLQRVRDMNIFGDRELERQVAALSSVIDRAETMETKTLNGGILTELAGMQNMIEQSVEEAVRAAEENLTGYGQRKISIAGGE